MSVIFFTIIIFCGKWMMIYKLTFMQNIVLIVLMFITPILVKIVSTIVDKIRILNIDYEKHL